MKIGLRIVLALVIVGGCAKKTETQQKKEMSKEPVAVRAPQEPAGPLEGPYLAVANYDFGKSRSELSAVEDEIRKAGPADYPSIEAKLIAVLRNSQATVAGKQFACRMLERVGSKTSVPVLAGMLGDEKLSYMARFVLERMPEPEATAALRDGLDRVKGRQRVGIIASLGQKRDEESVEKLASMVNDPDPDVARAAVVALGEIGTEKSAKALEEIGGKAGQALVSVLAQAQINCARNLARDGKSAEATALYKKLMDGKYSDAIRVAALGGWIAVAPQPEAVKMILLTTEGDEEEMKAAAMVALTPNASGELRNAVAAAIPDLKSEAQVQLLTIFSDQRSVSLRPMLLKIIHAAGSIDVRKAALNAMITHGTAEDVPFLLELAANPEGEDARRTLQQMGANGVDEALIESADKGDKGAKYLIIRTLAARNAKAAVPMLLNSVSGNDATLAREASSALGVVGNVEHLAPLTEIVVNANEGNVRNSATGAIKAICARTGDKEACANVILPALGRAQTPAAKIALVQTLSRLPIDKSLAALREAIKDGDEKVSDAAVRELADWPTIAAAQPLFEIAKDDTNQTHAVLALRGYIRLAGLKDRPVAERLTMLRQALVAARRKEEVKAAMSALGDLPSLEALEILQAQMKNDEMRADAASAIIRLAKQLGASQNGRMLALLHDMREQPTLESMRPQIDEGIKTLEDIAEKSQGFIVAWMTAGPYTQAGKNGGALFDIAFAPEKDEKVDWKPLIRPADAADLWMIDLHKVIGQGNDRVAYLKTNINSAREQKAMLEVGSDDGVKMWVNGKLVHANNAARPLKQADDKVKIDLKQGSNVVLMKITQGGGDWAACARLVGEDGKKIDDVQMSAE